MQCETEGINFGKELNSCLQSEHALENIKLPIFS